MTINKDNCVDQTVRGYISIGVPGVPVSVPVSVPSIFLFFFFFLTTTTGFF